MKDENIDRGDTSRRRFLQSIRGGSPGLAPMARGSARLAEAKSSRKTAGRLSGPELLRQFEGRANGHSIDGHAWTAAASSYLESPGGFSGREKRGFSITVREHDRDCLNRVIRVVHQMHGHSFAVAGDEHV